MKITSKKERQNKLLQLLRTKPIENQHQLLNELECLGVFTNQATISRDINELDIIKTQGLYRLADCSSQKSAALILKLIPVGENLIVIHTPPGQASFVALKIDMAKIPEIAGTIAGDDTIFVAVFSQSGQKNTLKWLLKASIA